MTWLKNSYIILPEKDLKDKFFANKIFEFIFQKAEPISFFRIIGFTMFINDFVYDDQILEERIFAYASEPNIFIGIGRIYSLKIELLQRKIGHINLYYILVHKDTITYKMKIF